MSMVGFPLLLIPLAIYNIIVFLMPGVKLTETLVTIPLTSGEGWPVTLSDILLTLGILMLLLEVIKGARPGARYLTDHLLSLLVLGGAIAEFLLWPRFANSTFFLLALLAMTEFFSGLALRVRRVPAAAAASRNAKRDIALARQEPEPAEFHEDVRHETAPRPVDEPVGHEPASHESVGHGPVGHVAAGPEPIIDEPATHDPRNHEPVNHAPASEAPLSQAPANHSPASHSPVEPKFIDLDAPVIEPASEAPSVDTKPGHEEPRPPETAR